MQRTCFRICFSSGGGELLTSFLHHNVMAWLGRLLSTSLCSKLTSDIRDYFDGRRTNILHDRYLSISLRYIVLISAYCITSINRFPSQPDGGILFVD